MTLALVFGALNATLAVVSALVGAAPFTPAIVLFIMYLPLAAVLAHKNQTVAGLLVIAAAALAWLVSPLRSPITAPAVAWLIWVCFWSAVIAFASRRKISVLIATVRGGGIHGA